MMRWLHRLRASIGHYFGLPCDRCGQHFGGHERGWKPRDVSIVGDGLLCPRCAASAPGPGERAAMRLIFGEGAGS